MSTATTVGTQYTTLANLPVTVKKTQTTETIYYKYSTNPVFFLYYCKTDKIDERCETTDILTQNGNGTILHVLDNAHVFGVFTKKTVK
jgi:hypothetical protein